ncbi:MAG: hypothetical protein P8R42_14675 [Candidatus Binatia bacterium]|nr:hypothetical protein [Candidatus Binatia bacterium]
MTKPQKLTLGIGIAALVTAIAAQAVPGLPGWLLAWTSLSCTISAGAYVANRPQAYGKRDGRLVWWRALPTAVFVGAFRIACAMMRWWRGRPVKSQITSHLWIAGRIEAGELPDVDFVVDLVSEFPEPRAVRERAGYRSLPVLDGGVPPDDDAVLALLDEVSLPDAAVLVHCDSGMGRAPTFGALLLLRRGDAATTADAIAMIERERPFIHLGVADRAFLARLEPLVRPLAVEPAAAAAF